MKFSERLTQARNQVQGYATKKVGESLTKANQMRKDTQATLETKAKDITQKLPSRDKITEQAKAQLAKLPIPNTIKAAAQKVANVLEHPITTNATLTGDALYHFTQAAQKLVKGEGIRGKVGAVPHAILGAAALKNLRRKPPVRQVPVETLTPAAEVSPLSLKIENRRVEFTLPLTLETLIESINNPDHPPQITLPQEFAEILAGEVPTAGLTYTQNSTTRYNCLSLNFRPDVDIAYIERINIEDSEKNKSSRDVSAPKNSTGRYLLNAYHGTCISIHLQDGRVYVIKNNRYTELEQKAQQEAGISTSKD
jgi:hypothetical protein